MYFLKKNFVRETIIECVFANIPPVFDSETEKAILKDFFLVFLPMSGGSIQDLKMFILG